MYGFKIPLGYEDAIRLGKLHGNDEWHSATKLEMDQLHEYDTFHDKGIGTTAGEKVQEDPSELILCMHASTGFYLVRFVVESQYFHKWINGHARTSLGKYW
jgi:hypothetical protein